MTVYVDNQNAYGRIVRGTRTVPGEWSRLLADDPAELAEFALNLDLLPEWVRAPGTPAECYDVGELTRRRAIAAGAVPISQPRGTGNVIATKTLLTSALDAASRGWRVFPLRAGTKVPALRHWEHEATIDTERIKDLWTADLRRRDGWFVPEPSNVGIACGPSGLVVLDLDLPKTDDRTGWAEQWRSRGITSGAQVVDALAEQAGQNLPDTYTVATPSGGRHLYFTAPDGTQIRNSAGRVGPMIDIRGEGGYVVAPGSRMHPHYYEPHNDTIDHGEPSYSLLIDLDTATLPDWIADAATPDRNRDDQPGLGRRLAPSRGRSLGGRGDGYSAAALRGEADRVRTAPVGQRNHTLNAAAYSLGQLVAAGALNHTNTVDALTDAAQTAGLTSAEIAATIDSGLRAGADKPRILPPARAQHDGETGRASAELDQPEQAVGTRRDSDGVDVEADLDRVFGLEPAVAVPIVAGLIIDAPSDKRAAVLREAATWIARLVDDDGIDGQYALNALSAAARRTGMTKTEIDDAVAAGFARSADTADVRSAGLAPAEPLVTVDPGLSDGMQYPPPSSPASAADAVPIPHVTVSRSADPAASENGGRAGPADDLDRPPAEEPGGPPFRIDEVDAAYAGFLFDHTWEAISHDRTPCFPAETLRIACEGEGLPTLGNSNPRDRPRTPARFVPAPGEELVNKKVFESWSQAQQDEWHLSQPERAAAAGAAMPTHPQLPEATPRDEIVAAGSRQVDPGEAAATDTDTGGSALDEPIDAEALVRALLGTLQTRGMIDRAAWDATVTAVANRSAAADRRQVEEAVDQTQRSEGVDRDVDRPVGRTQSAPAPEQLLDAPGPADTPIVDPKPAPIAPESGSDSRRALDDAIGEARAAVDQLGSARADHRRRSHDTAADTVREVRENRPAYWAETEVGL